MMLLGMVIGILGGLYIWKNIAVILLPYIQCLVEKVNFSRSEDGNDMVTFFILLITTFLVMLISLFIIGKIFGGFGIIIIIALCVYFRIGTDKGRLR